MKLNIECVSSKIKWAWLNGIGSHLLFIFQSLISVPFWGISVQKSELKKSPFSHHMCHRNLRTFTLWVVGFSTPALEITILLVTAPWNALLIKPGLPALECAQVSTHNQSLTFTITMNYNVTLSDFSSSLEVPPWLPLWWHHSLSFTAGLWHRGDSHLVLSSR